MRRWQRALLGALLVGAVAVAGIALNFTLLQLTQDAHDPVGKLSPRAVFMPTTPPGDDAGATSTTPAATVPSSGEDERERDD